MGASKEYPVIVRNENGQEIYREDVNGHWVKRAYDEKGRQVYWEISSGEWAKHRFDDAGNTVWYENHEGFSFVAEYSERGIRTYYEDSDGKVFGTKSVDSLVKDAEERSGAAHELGTATRQEPGYAGLLAAQPCGASRKEEKGTRDGIHQL